MSLSPSVVVGVRQLLLLDGPRVSLVRFRTCGGGHNNKTSASSKSKKYTTEPCRICAHRHGENQVLSSDDHHHLDLLETIGVEGTYDDRGRTLCTLCLSLVERLTRLTEDVEDIRARIKVVMKMTGSTTSQSPVTSPIKTKVSNSPPPEGEVGQIPYVQEEDRVTQDQEVDTPSSEGGIQTIFCHDVVSPDDQDFDGAPSQPMPLFKQELHGCEEVQDEVCHEVSSFDDDDDDAPFVPDDISPKGSDDDDEDVKMTCEGTNDEGCEGDMTEEQGDFDMPSPTPPDSLEGMMDRTLEEPFVRVHNTRSRVSTLARYQGQETVPQSTLSNPTKGYDRNYRYVCPICKIRLRNRHLFNAHTHPDPQGDPTRVVYNCACGMSYESRSQYQSHWQKTHKEKRQRKVDPSMTLPCFFCSRRMRLRYLSDHMRGHTLERPFLCTTCGKDYISSRSFRQHSCETAKSKGRSSPLKQDQCPVCGKVFANLANLRQHVRAIHNSTKMTLNLATATMTEKGHKDFTCPECGKRCTNMECLKKHLKRVHLLDTTNRRKCDICSKNFNNLDIFQAHTHPDRSDPTTFVYSCSICHKTFRNSDGYRVHTLTMHQRIRKQCDPCYFCGKTMRRRYLGNHMRGHTLERVQQEQCHICGKVFANSQNLRQHVRAIHKSAKVTLNLEPMIEKGRRDFTCPECGKSFANKYSLKNHLKQVHLLDTTNRQKCDICSKNFNSLDIFKAHTHPNPSDLTKFVYSCSICLKTFRNRDRYRAHKISMHERVKKQCDHCGRLFQYQSDLQLHAASCYLPPEEANRCSFDPCGAVFPTLNERLDHERVVHKGMTSTKCYFCPKTFPTPIQLENHSRTHTLERPFFCEKCGKDFPFSATLKNTWTESVAQMKGEGGKPEGRGGKL